MALHDYKCQACSRVTERIEITTSDKAEPPPECCGSPMERQCGSCSFVETTMRGTWVRFKSNRPPVEGDKHAKGL